MLPVSMYALTLRVYLWCAVHLHRISRMRMHMRVSKRIDRHPSMSRVAFTEAAKWVPTKPFRAGRFGQ